MTLIVSGVFPWKNLEICGEKWPFCQATMARWPENTAWVATARLGSIGLNYRNREGVYIIPIHITLTSE